MPHYYREIEIWDNPALAEVLPQLGASPEVIEVILAEEDPKLKGLMLNAVKKHPEITLEELGRIAPPKKREPTYEESRFAAAYVRDVQNNEEKEFSAWVLIQLMKNRSDEEDYYEFPGGGELFRINEAEMRRFFNRIYDWYSDTGVQIASYDLRRAWDASEVWHDACSLEGSGKVYGRIDPKNIVHEFDDPEGWTIQAVTTENDLSVEGSKMQHCVGSYFDRVNAGQSRIFSLRDDKNQPHVTVELRGDKDAVVQIQGKQDKPPIKKYKELTGEWLQQFGAYHEGESESITYLMWEKYSPDEILYALSDYYTYASGNTDDGYGEEEDEYGIPTVTRIDYEDAPEILSAAIDIWKQKLKDTHPQARGLHVEPSQILEIAEGIVAFARGGPPGEPNQIPKLAARAWKELLNDPVAGEFQAQTGLDITSSEGGMAYAAWISENATRGLQVLALCLAVLIQLGEIEPPEGRGMFEQEPPGQQKWDWNPADA